MLIFRSNITGPSLLALSLLGAVAIGSDASAQDYRYDTRSQYADPAQELGRASETCLDGIQRARDRVDTIDEVRRTRDGWQVTGQVERGGQWICTVDRDGRVRDIEFETDRYSAPRDDYRYDEPAYPSYPEERYSDPVPSSGQWTAEDYARARARTRTPADGGYEYRDDRYPPAPQPSYPGGPVSRDDYTYEVDGDMDEGTWGGDGRYETGSTPDFRQPGY